MPNRTYDQLEEREKIIWDLSRAQQHLREANGFQALVVLKNTVENLKNYLTKPEGGVR